MAIKIENNIFSVVHIDNFSQHTDNSFLYNFKYLRAHSGCGEASPTLQVGMILDDVFLFPRFTFFFFLLNLLAACHKVTDYAVVTLLLSIFLDICHNLFTLELTRFHCFPALNYVICLQVDDCQFRQQHRAPVYF